MLTGSKKKQFESLEIHYHRFRGIGKAGEIIKGFSKENPILVYFDPDIDGLIAGYFVCKFLVSKGYRFTWYINRNREHGFKIPVEKLKGIGGIIAVDFLMSYRELVSVVRGGVSIVSMDHHVKEDGGYFRDGSCEGVIINNQYEFEDEDSRYLSGAGVVFECLREFDRGFDTKENRALVGLTLLSDVRDIENANARGYLMDLYSHKCKGYIGYLISNTIGDVDYGFGVPRMDRNFVDFTFSPVINSCLRFGLEKEVVNFILGSGKIDREYRIKQREFVEHLLEVSEKVDYGSLYYVRIDGSDLTDFEYSVATNFVGLVASRCLDGSHSCICSIVGLEGRILRASFRGHINGLGYLSALNDTGKLIGVGHEPAFGITWLDDSRKSLEVLASECAEVDDGWKGRGGETVRYVSNLSVFVGVDGFNLGFENLFCLSQNRTYIRYTGYNIVKRRSGAKFVEYGIDGVSVLCFDPDISVRNGLILPILERGLLFLYLQGEDYYGDSDEIVI